jgi:hypothetical protein
MINETSMENRPAPPIRNKGEAKLTIRSIGNLHPHPCYVRHGLSVSTAKLSALIATGDVAFREPIVTDQDGTIVDGYARVEVARLQGRPTLACLEYYLTEHEALTCLLQRHRRSDGLNAFCRTCLALELEPEFKEQARRNQQVGGQHKGSSNLTQAERIDVRIEVAKIAGVSVGNVSKVKRLTNAHPKLIQALLGGEISINVASSWSAQPLNEQLGSLHKYQTERGMTKTIHALLSQHKAKHLFAVPSLSRLIACLGSLAPKELDSVGIQIIDVPGHTVFLSRSLAQSLEIQKGLQLL